MKGPAPSEVTRNTGSRLWISSDETSISRLTKPSIQIAAGRRTGAGAGGGDGEEGAGGTVIEAEARGLAGNELLAILSWRTAAVEITWIKDCAASAI
ncbi:hypothetical protein AZKH_3445 [Azoarcus sp. KH32C]|nr:hypothetical protein AZKH_3445 [Azoarcus sp. KH32C]